MGKMKEIDIYLQEIENLKAHISELNTIIANLEFELKIAQQHVKGD